MLICSYLFLTTMLLLDIKKFRDKHGLTQSELAKILGVDQSRISRIEKFQQWLTAGQEAILMERFGPLEAYYVSDETVPPLPMDLNEPDARYGSGKSLLYVPQPAEAGFLSGDVSPFTNEDLISYSGLPNFDKPGFAFEVVGASMEPTLKSGEVIVTSRQEVTDASKLTLGEIYVIEHDAAILVKRLTEINKEKETITLKSDNEDELRYKPITIPFNLVRKMWRGRRIIKYDLSKKARNE